MESEDYRRKREADIKKRLIDLQTRGERTSKGEPISLAAIGRTLDPPVQRQAVYLVIQGKAESRRIKEAVERELGSPYWIRRNVA
jgi:hypothetical protein